MGVLFGKHKKVSRVTEQDKAILQLKQQRDKIKQYQKKIFSTLENERQLARKLLHEGRKEKAMLLLKKKRFMEQMLEKTDGQLTNLERMVHDIEYAQIEIQVVEGLKVGNESLKKLHEVLSVEAIEKLIDETQEGIEKQKEIDDLLSGQLTAQDDEAVLAELEALVSEEEARAVLDLPSVPAESGELLLPNVPSMAEAAGPPKKVRKEQKTEALVAS
ncbi:charged multivesicular body protein 6-A [Dermacentor andersoni]|uniref:charged multivesicular body protein 6-A n=1 Tax=Dermacentor andersoni TaxID=34620 RepID=UPI002155DD02|nr:charged multivesicular body protein 6-A-like [Dermacentor andersoni]